jgi:bacteriorhodopsin
VTRDGSAAAAGVTTTPIIAYGVFVVLTPIVVWGLYASRAVEAGKKLPRSLASWPKWEMVAATLAFAAWAAALPSSPLERYGWFTAGLAGVVALVLSMLIGLFAPIFSSNALASK